MEISKTIQTSPEREKPDRTAPGPKLVERLSERQVAPPRRAQKVVNVASGELSTEYQTPDLTKSTVESEVEGLLLAYLPRKFATNYQKGQTIYEESHPSRYLHLIVNGRVEIRATSDDGHETMVDIFVRNDIFGESALLGAEYVPERARALDSVTLLSWSDEEIEEEIERRPRLGIALVRMFVSRQLGYKARIQCLASKKTSERLVRSLLYLAKHMGTPAQDGFVEIPALSHKRIAEYVGSTRERISIEMNTLRNKGLLRYSRKCIQTHTDQLESHLGKIGNGEETNAHGA
jgi:CRP-like cAMP-binding protein